MGILPTDTLYGLSCNALDARAVDRICRIKARRRPLSLIPHSRAWAHAQVAGVRERVFLGTLDRYAGAYTTLWPRVAQCDVYASTLSGTAIGFREPEHWVTAVVRAAGVPVVSSSVNRTGQPPMTCLDDLPARIRRMVDFCVYEGPLPGPASRLVHLEGGRRRIEVRA